MTTIEQKTALVRHDVLSPLILINWAPGDTGSITFNLERFTYIDTELSGRRPLGPLSVPIPDILPRSFPVTLSDGSVVNVPTALVMGYIKSAVDTYYAEKVAAEPGWPDAEPTMQPRVIPDHDPGKAT